MKHTMHISVLLLAVPSFAQAMLIDRESRPAAQLTVKRQELPEWARPSAAKPPTHLDKTIMRYEPLAIATESYGSIDEKFDKKATITRNNIPLALIEYTLTGGKLIVPAIAHLPPFEYKNDCFQATIKRIALTEAGKALADNGYNKYVLRCVSLYIALNDLRRLHAKQEKTLYSAGSSLHIDSPHDPEAGTLFEDVGFKTLTHPYNGQMSYLLTASPEDSSPKFDDDDTLLAIIDEMLERKEPVAKSHKRKNSESLQEQQAPRRSARLALKAAAEKK